MADISISDNFEDDVETELDAGNPIIDDKTPSPEEFINDLVDSLSPEELELLKTKLGEM